MGRGYAAAKARGQAAGTTAAGQGAIAEPVAAAQPTPAPGTAAEEALIQRLVDEGASRGDAQGMVEAMQLRNREVVATTPNAISDRSNRLLSLDGIQLSGQDRNVVTMNANETMAALIPGGTRIGGSPIGTITAMTGEVPTVLRNDRGDAVGVLIRSRLNGRDGISRTLVTLTPRDEYRMTHYTRRGREVSRQEGFDPADMARIYRDTTGIALGL